MTKKTLDEIIDEARELIEREIEWALDEHEKLNDPLAKERARGYALGLMAARLMIEEIEGGFE